MQVRGDVSVVVEVGLLSHLPLTVLLYQGDRMLLESFLMCRESVEVLAMAARLNLDVDVN